MSFLAGTSLMKRYCHYLLRPLGFTFLFAAVILGLGRADSVPASSPRERLSFDQDWRFQKGDPAEVAGKLGYDVLKPWMLPTGNAFVSDPAAKASRPTGNPGGEVSYAQPNFDDSSWRQLNLPHDWAIEGPFLKDQPNETGRRAFVGVGWYRKHFNIPATDQGKQFFLDVDGAMAHATVWINGQCAGGWPYGYASFRVDLTPYVQPGKDNVVAIRLETLPESSRWYPGAGIYRHVWLVESAPVHVAHWGIYVTTPEVTPDSATVAVRTTLDNASDSDAQTQVQTAIYALDVKGAKSGAAVATSNWTPVTIPAGNGASTDAKLQIAHPLLWDLDKPNLYAAVTSVRQGNNVVDSEETVFGVRTIKFDPDQGFLLNGRRVPLQGVCMHSDLGALGMALNTRALQRQIEILKAMGCNAIRTSHNPPSPDLIDLCNRMGMLVMAESLDCWKWGKKKNDYSLLFNDWSEKDIRALVRHFRNNPSIIIWSLGNEVGEGKDSHAPPIARQLTTYAHEEDPTRPTTEGCQFPDGGFTGLADALGLFGYNYHPWMYEKFHTANPTRPLVATETSSTTSSRGVYFLPLKDGVRDGQVSSYDNIFPGWGTLPDTQFEALEKNPNVAGEFVWTGFDYLGEPSPFPANSDSRSSYYGIVDLAGFKKDRFYLYQAHWRPDYPMAHLLPHWNWPDQVGKTVPVYLYTSGDEGELFLNGQSLGRKSKKPYEYRLKWDVTYQPGEIDAVAYKGGKEWARDTVKTTGPVAQMLLQPDRTTIAADGQDLSFVTLALADKDGLTAPGSNNTVHFQVSGPADIIGVDNGDATDLTSFQDPTRKAFNGLVLVILRSHKGEPGAITLTAESDGLPSAHVSLTSQ